MKIKVNCRRGGRVRNGPMIFAIGDFLERPFPPSAERPRPRPSDPARKPRVLSILSPAPDRNNDVAAPVNPEPRTTRHIPRSHHARIRTWVNYGLTIPQVAEVYGVAVGVIERILREA
jgi:hypothetical protein